MPEKNRKNQSRKNNKASEKSNKKINTNTNTKKQKKSHKKLKTFLKVLLIIFLLLCVIAAGVIAAVFFGLFGDDFSITKQELTVGANNSVIINQDGRETDLSSDEKRKTIKLSEMPEYLPKAYVAIEDKRFYQHNGVDLKRTTGAIIGVLTRNSSYGGSTITQQLVKNITNDKERNGIAGIIRKVKEWAKAVQVERMLSKDQILELYLNVIFVGGNDINGVELGAEYYFNKQAKDLSIAECAFLAGINNAPTSYDPFDTSKDQTKTAELRKNKTLTVLKEMKDQGMFANNEDDYNNAVEEVNNGLKFEKGYTGEITYSYHTDALLRQLTAQVMEEKNMSEEMAKNYIYSSGFTIYSTEKTSVQDAIDEEFAKSQFQPRVVDENGKKLNDGPTQAAIVVIDHTTGQVVGVGGKLGEQDPTGLNRAVKSIRQTGSSMKIIADIAPGLQEKVITPATVYDDVWTDFNGYPPKDWNIPRGLINIRQCIQTSQNIPMVKVMRELTTTKAISYLRKSGITTLDDKGDANLALAIGGLHYGISPLEMAGAYATIANDGVYITPTFYTKVVDSEGKTVMTPKQEKTRVYSEQVAYLTRSIAEEPVKSGGTATYCAIPGMETCAKTGSTDEYKDRWLCGMTPYYTAACWRGFDVPEPLRWGGEGSKTYSVDGRNPAGQLWSTIMKASHKGLANKNFNKPTSGLTTATVCRVTGCLATSSCTDTYTETFTTDNLPTKCEGHGTQDICQASGKVANEYCPKDQVKKVSYGGTIPKEKMGLWKAKGASSKIGTEKVTETCTIHKKTEEKKIEKPASETNTINNTTKEPTNNNNSSSTTNGSSTAKPSTTPAATTGTGGTTTPTTTDSEKKNTGTSKEKSE